MRSQKEGLGSGRVFAFSETKLAESVLAVIVPYSSSMVAGVLLVSI